MKARTVDTREIAHFSKDSANWWDPDGPFRPLHWMTPTRMEFICNTIRSHFEHGFKNLTVLDVGCGGGLACEPMARLGATVTGVDADTTAIEVAREHAAGQRLKIDYVNGAAEDLVEDKQKFDVVLALEVIEHVSDPDEFMSLCSKLVKPDGLLIVSTLNRTWKSYALGIIAAEHILQWAPKGTHDWKKFVKPSELARMTRANGLEVSDVCGVVYNPLERDFALHRRDVDVNYFLVAKR